MVVIGAGLGGLAVAGRLAKAGYQVEVLEKNQHEGNYTVVVPHRKLTEISGYRSYVVVVMQRGQLPQKQHHQRFTLGRYGRFIPLPQPRGAGRAGEGAGSGCRCPRGHWRGVQRELFLDHDISS